jgi:hypothetical protein
MNTRNIIPWTYAVSVGAFCLAIYSKMTGFEDVFTFFVTALVSQLLFAFFSIYELRGSEHFTQKRKSQLDSLITMCTIDFWYRLPDKIKTKDIFYLSLYIT